MKIFNITNSRTFNLGCSLDAIECCLEWKIKTVQEKVVEPTKSIEWEDDQTYQVHDDEERRVYFEEEAIEN